MRIRLFVLTLLFFSGPALLQGAEIEGVRFADRHVAGPAAMSLRGAALLRYMVVIRAYVGALYVAEGRAAADLFKGDTAKRLELSYFHAIPAKDFSKSTRIMMEKNVSPEQFKALGPRLAQMNALYRDVRPGDRYAATYVPGVGTELALNGKPLGVVPGADFAAAYFAIWLGDNPIDGKFRDRLLGKENP